MRPRRLLGTLLALGLSMAAGFAVAPTAQAVTGSPPVTTPDAAKVFPGNFVAVFPINNDHDPDNDLLTICRLGTEHYKGIDVSFFENELDVLAAPRVKPGTYTFTYYTCDYSYLVPGTVTLTVEAAPEITVKKLGGQPGKLRVTNPADFKIRFLYGSFKEERPDGRLVIAKGASVVIPVHRSRIDWIAFNRKGDVFLANGHVTGIKLSRTAPGPVDTVRLPAGLAKAWRTA